MLGIHVRSDLLCTHEIILSGGSRRKIIIGFLRYPPKLGSDKDPFFFGEGLLLCGTAQELNVVSLVTPL